jgi:hypothetical protein
MTVPPVNSSLLILTLILFGSLIFSCQGRPATPPTPPVITTNAPPQATGTLTPSPSFTSTPQILPTLAPTLTPLACPPPAAPRQVGTVVEILDAVHARIVIAGLTYRVKYLGLVAPLPNSNYFETSRQKSAELTKTQSVILISGPLDKDPTGALLRYIYAGQTFVNLELLKLGYAAWDHNDPLDADCQAAWQTASDAALLSGAGAWAQGNNLQFLSTPTLRVYYVLPTETALPRYFTAVPGSPEDIYDRNGDGRVTCADFDTQTQAQAAYYAGYTRLDIDDDGIACENLP